MTVTVQRNLRAEDYPVTLVGAIERTGQIVWMVTLLRPTKGNKGSLYVPPLRRIHGEPVIVRACDPTELALALDDRPVW